MWLWWWILSWFTNINKNLLDPLIGYVVPTDQVKNYELPTPTASPTIKKIQFVTPKPTEVWGVSKQIGPVTWTMKVGMDERMATPKEIVAALNVYRIRRGSQPLTWNENLANFAQSRADYLESIRSTDSHKGFEDYLNNQNGFEILGFTWLGENISYGYQLEAVHLIEWLYAGDKPHDDNQVDNRWNYVGVGVNGTANSIIFGTGKR